jgi:DNA-binding response OmpR family regulator
VDEADDAMPPQSLSVRSEREASLPVLLTQIWGIEHSKDSHYLHIYIGQLRRKIEPDPMLPRLLVTVPGVGYRFSADDG